jgi:glycosyltransferase involved in cell wall biosynthesis
MESENLGLHYSHVFWLAKAPVSQNSFEMKFLSMRIGFDVAQTCSTKAGCGWVADLLAKSIAENAVGDQLILYHQFGTLLNSDTSNGTHIFRPNTSEPFDRMPVAKARDLWTAVAAGERELPGNPDIVHANSFRAPSIGPAKLVYTIYDMSFWIYPEFTTEENRLVCQEGTLNAISRAAGFVFISESSRREFEKIFPSVSARSNLVSVVAPLASRFSPVASSRSTVPDGGWLAVGSLEPRKNYSAIFDAIESYWQQSKVCRPLVIAGGSGWKSEDLRRRMQDLEQRGLVRYEGYVPEEKLKRLYQESFALVFPSHYEGFGLPIVEAMSQSCPVITRRNSSLEEVGGTAALYYDQSSDELVQLMLALENQPKFYLDRCRLAYSQAKQFDWNITAQKVLELYRAVLEQI